jgi:hypothetical protein
LLKKYFKKEWYVIKLIIGGNYERSTKRLFN